MIAVGFMLFTFGALSIWAALHRAIVFDLLRGFIGANPPQRTATGATA